MVLQRESDRGSEDIRTIRSSHDNGGDPSNVIVVLYHELEIFAVLIKLDMHRV
jgi:hypothetical protein